MTLTLFLHFLFWKREKVILLLGVMNEMVNFNFLCHNLIYIFLETEHYALQKIIIILSTGCCSTLKMSISIFANSKPSLLIQIFWPSHRLVLFDRMSQCCCTEKKLVKSALPIIKQTSFQFFYKIVSPLSYKYHTILRIYILSLKIIKSTNNSRIKNLHNGCDIYE